MEDSLVAFISSTLMGMLIPPRFRTEGKLDRQREEGDEEVINHNHFIMQICASVGGLVVSDCCTRGGEKGGMNAFPLSCLVLMLAGEGR